MFKSVVYWGNSLLGEVEIYPQNQKIDMSNKQIRISHFSQPSERCPPLAVLHTIARSGVCFKMESKSQLEDSPLFSLHSSCLREKKTAVMQLGEEELHLVAMSSRKSPMQYPCFWGFNLAPGLYKSCLILLNLRCLGIVFDLDETLVVANTIRSFEDRIDALQRKVNTEMDPVRISGMLAEIKRYQDDRNILKQYVESDQVVENGKVIKVQSEVVPALSDYHQSIVRPIIRLQEKNIILTRINPMIRDTSVLVRLRPAWEDLRTYITAKGRKRFEVYVCTMAEKDYALEMWRLLDPDSNLINSKELPDRIVSVKAGSKKSLLNVFHDGTCHPKMALVIDDRVNVWEEIDQPRVHIVPAFAPYYSPQAEANNAVPVLCVARNVACNVRGGFFKEFDEDLLQRILGVFYEDDICSIPSPPDVSNYLSSEDDVSTSNKDPLHFEGITDVEVERRLKDAILSSSMVKNLDPRFVPLQLSTATSSSTVSQFTSQGSIVSLHDKQLPQAALSVNSLGYGGPLEPSLQSSPGREEGEVPESELDPDTRRRLLILQHGQDMREQTSSEPISLRPLKVSAPPVQSHGRWFPLEEEMSPRQLNLAVPKPVTKEIHVESEVLLFDNRRPPRPSFFHGAKSYGPFDRTLHNNRRFHKEAHHGDDWLRSKNSFPKYHPFSGEEMPLALSDSSKRDLHFELERGSPPYAETPAGVLQDIAVRCGAKVEFRPALLASTELQFSIEVWFAGEKISEGIGKTRKEAQHQASERCIKNLADKYLSITMPDRSAVLEDLSKLSHENENYSNSFGHQPFPKEEPMPISITSELSRLMDPRLEGSKKSVGAVSALTELCIMEGLTLGFQSQPSLSTSSIHKGEARVQAEIGGKILGKGIGLTWDEAKIWAAEEALGNLKSMLDQGTHKRLGFSKVVTRTPK